MHHWDAVSAAGGRLAIEPPVAADSVEEFLTFSVPPWPRTRPAHPALAGQFALRATRTPGRRGRCAMTRCPARSGTTGRPGGPPTVTRTASDLLLSWLYGRAPGPRQGARGPTGPGSTRSPRPTDPAPDRRPARPGSSRTTATPPGATSGRATHGTRTAVPTRTRR